MKRAVFLDRDGTLIEDKDYLHRVEDVVIYRRAPEALKKLQDAGFLLIIVTNQSGIGRGYFTLADCERVHQHLEQEFGKAGVTFAKIYVAPEAPDRPSRGRKPSPQFLFDARDEFGIHLSRSYVVGDKFIDLQSGWNAKTRRSILVRTGYGAQMEKKHAAEIGGAIVVDDIYAAADWILADS